MTQINHSRNSPTHTKSTKNETNEQQSNNQFVADRQTTHNTNKEPTNERTDTRGMTYGHLRMSCVRGMMMVRVCVLIDPPAPIVIRRRPSSSAKHQGESLLRNSNSSSKREKARVRRR